jgi:hypothetical protein
VRRLVSTSDSFADTVERKKFEKDAVRSLVSTSDSFADTVECKKVRESHRPLSGLKKMSGAPPVSPPPAIILPLPPLAAVPMQVPPPPAAALTQVPPPPAAAVVKPMKPIMAILVETSKGVWTVRRSGGLPKEDWTGLIAPSWVVSPLQLT